jgi:hypothetical protein
MVNLPGDMSMFPGFNFGTISIKPTYSIRADMTSRYVAEDIVLSRLMEEKYAHITKKNILYPIQQTPS